jgi:hypothetical protein
MVQALAMMAQTQQASREHFQGVAQRLEENQRVIMGIVREK